MGIEPTLSAWKAEVLPLNYTRPPSQIEKLNSLEGGGFEPPKAEPTDLQSAPFDRSGTPPAIYLKEPHIMTVLKKMSTLKFKLYPSILNTYQFFNFIRSYVGKIDNNFRSC